jgi:hypothetical protein
MMISVSRDLTLEGLSLPPFSDRDFKEPHSIRRFLRSGVAIRKSFIAREPDKVGLSSPRTMTNYELIKLGPSVIMNEILQGAAGAAEH